MAESQVYPVRIPHEIVVAGEARAQGEGTTLRAKLLEFASEYAGAAYSPLKIGLAANPEKASEMAHLSHAARKKRRKKKKLSSKKP